jgi:hypothetical protein
MLEEFQETVNTFGYSENTVYHSCLRKTKFRQVFSEARQFNTTHIIQLQDEKYQVEDI